MFHINQVYLPTYAVKVVIVSTIWYRKPWKPKIYKEAHYFSLYHQPAAPSTDFEGSAIKCWCLIGLLGSFFYHVYILLYK